MKNDTQDELNESSIYTGNMPDQAEQKNELQGSEHDDEFTAADKKKYHSSAMYAASKWHNTVSHVKAHSNRGLDL